MMSIENTNASRVMLKVRFINDDWSGLPDGHFIKKVLVVGDPLPVNAGEYAVKSHAFINGSFFYELEGFDYSAYGVIGVFNEKRFETIEDGFAPNHICEVTGELAEARRYYVDIPGLEHIKELQYLSVSLMIEEGLVDSVSN